jgi:hypothetical protein
MHSAPEAFFIDCGAAGSRTPVFMWSYMFYFADIVSFVKTHLNIID